MSFRAVLRWTRTHWKWLRSLRVMVRLYLNITRSIQLVLPAAKNEEIERLLELSISCRRLIDKIASIVLPYYKRYFNARNPKLDRLSNVSIRFNIKSGTPKKSIISFSLLCFSFLSRILISDEIIYLYKHVSSKINVDSIGDRLILENFG